MLWKRLSLTEEEGSEYTGQKVDTLRGTIIAAKFFTRRVLNMEAIARTFKQLWATKKGFEVKDMGNHVVLFVFSDKTDADKVLLGEPWSYDKYLVSLRRLEKNGAVKDLVFDRTAFWIQLHDIPICDMTPEAAAEIGKVCGEVQPSIREWGNQDGSTFMRIRVRVDTSKPLCRGRKFRHEDGEIGWISFKYERLPIMCYWCGRLSHSDKDCEQWIRSNGSLTESNRQFGAWLRAPTYNTRKCSAVRVGGEEEAKSDGRGDEALEKVDAALGGRNEKVSTSEPDDSHRRKERKGVQSNARTETHAFSGPSNYEVHDSSGNPDFQDTLRDIDAVISKFDKHEMGSKPSGLGSSLDQAEAQGPSITMGDMGCPVSTEEELNQVEGPLSVEQKLRGWKRLVQDRPHNETQAMPIQRKRVLREEEEHEPGTPWKKLCPTEITKKQTVEATEQPRREQ